MKRLLAPPTGLAIRICALCSSLLMLTGAAALAQSAEQAAPPVPAQPSVQDEATGGCEPIGLTASGEIVVPFRCKAMVERQRAAATKPADPKPAVASAVHAQEKSRAKLQEPDRQKPQAKLQAKPQVQPVVASAKTAAVHPAGAAQATVKPAVQPVDAAHLPKTAEPKTDEPKTVDPKTTDTKTTDAKTTDTKTAETKTVATTKGIQQVAGTGRQHPMGPPGCTHFQSYNAVSATYLGFDGQRHPCRDAVGQVARNQVAGNQAARTQAPHKPSAADSKH